MSSPVSIFRPTNLTSVVYDSPHSGRYYPPTWRTAATREQLRLGEDAFVADLLKTSVPLGAALLVDNYPRCYIDVNREMSDIDPELLSDKWQGSMEPTEKSRRGLGLIRRFVVPGVPVNADRLSSSEVMDRIHNVYRPYHDALSELIESVLRVNRKVWHVNWHSMKSAGNAMTPDGPNAVRSDFVVSDNHGTTSDSELVDLIVLTLRERGYSVSVNEPYAGGTIVRKFGNPAAGVHSVQVEINRRLYLDEASVELNDGFSVLRGDIEHLTRVLVNHEC